MDPGINSNGVNESGKSTAYFIVGYVFLLATALFWSVDTSFVYILAGIAACFFFLGMYRNFSTGKMRASRESTETLRSNTSTFAAILNSIFKPASGDHKTTRDISPERNRRVATVGILAVFFLFIVFFIINVVGSTGESDRSASYFQSAEQFYWEGNYDSAYVNYRKAWTLNSDYAAAMVGYGKVLAVREQHDSALIMYDKALQVDPQLKDANYNKALVFYNQERYQEAVTILDPLLVTNDDYYDGMLLLGDAYYALNRFDEALAWYSNAYENGGTRSHALCYLMAYIYDMKGNYETAIDLYKEALNYDNSVVAIYVRLGELLPGDEGNAYREEAARLQRP